MSMQPSVSGIRVEIIAKRRCQSWLIGHYVVGRMARHKESLGIDPEVRTERNVLAHNLRSKNVVERWRFMKRVPHLVRNACAPQKARTSLFQVRSERTKPLFRQQTPLARVGDQHYVPGCKLGFLRIEITTRNRGQRERTKFIVQVPCSAYEYLIRSGCHTAAYAPADTSQRHTVAVRRVTPYCRHPRLTVSRKRRVSHGPLSQDCSRAFVGSPVNYARNRWVCDQTVEGTFIQQPDFLNPHARHHSPERRGSFYIEELFRGDKHQAPFPFQCSQRPLEEQQIEVESSSCSNERPTILFFLPRGKRSYRHVGRIADDEVEPAQIRFEKILMEYSNEWQAVEFRPQRRKMSGVRLDAHDHRRVPAVLFAPPKNTAYEGPSATAWVEHRVIARWRFARKETADHQVNRLSGRFDEPPHHASNSLKKGPRRD